MVGPDKDSSLLEDGSPFKGAIFLSNVVTRKESFKLKLFGLPSRKADIVQKIKVGMTLFLFDYLKQELYGVFEATSNGAMDIIPTAFISSGKSLSAQVRFKIICRCSPLTVPEFSDAIRDNYYTKNKFHLLLSHEQVFKLYVMFYSKCCNRHHKRVPRSIHPWTKLNKKRKNRIAQARTSVVGGIEGPLGPQVPEQSVLPGIVDLHSQGTCPFRGCLSVIEGNCSSQVVPGLHMKRSCISLDMDCAPTKELATHPGGFFGNQPLCRHQYHRTHTDQDILSMNNLQNSVARNPPNSVSITSLQNFNFPSSLGFTDHHHDHTSQNHLNYMKDFVEVTTSLPSPPRHEPFGYGHHAITPHSDFHGNACNSEFETRHPKKTDALLCSSPDRLLSEIPYASDRLEYQDKGSSSYHLYQGDEHYYVDKYHPGTTTSKFHSKSHGKGTNVLQRLSVLPKASAGKVNTCEQLVRCPAVRQKKWSKMSENQNLKKPTKVLDIVKMSAPTLKKLKKVFDQANLIDGSKQLENGDQMDRQNTAFCGTKKPCGEECIRDNSKPHFLNFKRRTRTHRVAHATERSNTDELKENELTLVKGKRRKLLKPSFSEEGGSKNVQGKIKPILEEKDGECNGSVFTAEDIGIGKHSTIGRCSPIGLSQKNLVDQGHITIIEHVGNTDFSPGSEFDPAKLMDTDSKVATILNEEEFNSQKIQESILCHNDPLLGNDCVNAYDECNIGGREMEMVNLSPENLLEKSGVSSKRVYILPNVQNPPEGFDVGSLFAKTDKIKEHTGYSVASHGDNRGKSRNGGENISQSYGTELSLGHHHIGTELSGDTTCGVKKYKGTEHPREDTSNHCNLELSPGNREIAIGKLSSDKYPNNGEIATSFQEVDANERLHFPEFSCQNPKYSPKISVSMVNTQVEPTTRNGFRGLNDEMISGPESRLPSASGVGKLPSNTIFDYSEANRVTEVYICPEKNSILGGYLPCSYGPTEALGNHHRIIYTEKSVTGITGFCEEGPSYKVLDNEFITLSAQSMTSQGSTARPCTAQTDKLTADPKAPLSDIKRSWQSKLCAAEDGQTQGSLSRSSTSLAAPSTGDHKDYLNKEILQAWHCASEVLGAQGSMPRPHTAQTAKSRANSEHYLNLGTVLQHPAGAMLRKVGDMRRNMNGRNPDRPAEIRFSLERLPLTEAAESTCATRRGGNENHGVTVKTSRRGPETMESLLELSLAVASAMPCLPADLRIDALPLSLGLPGTSSDSA